MTYKKRRKALGDKEVEAALESSAGIVKYAAQKLRVSRQTLYRYFRKKPEKWDAFRDALCEDCLDDAEHAILQKIKEKDVACIIFYLKTKGKHRGYVENQKVDLNHSLDARKAPPMVVKKDMDDATAAKAYSDLIKQYNNQK